MRYQLRQSSVSSIIITHHANFVKLFLRKDAEILFRFFNGEKAQKDQMPNKLSTSCKQRKKTLKRYQSLFSQAVKELCTKAGKQSSGGA